MYEYLEGACNSGELLQLTIGVGKYTGFFHKLAS